MRFRSINVRRPPGHTVFHPLKIYAVEASWFVVWIPGNARKTGSIRSYPSGEPVFAIGRRRPVEQRRIFRDKRGTGARRVRNFFRAILPSVRKRSLPSSLQLRSTSFLNLLDVVCVFHFDRNPHNSCGPEIGCLRTIKPLAAQHDPGSPRVHRRSVRGWRRPHCPLPVEHCGHRRSLR